MKTDETVKGRGGTGPNTRWIETPHGGYCEDLFVAHSAVTELWVRVRHPAAPKRPSDAAFSCPSEVRGRRECRVKASPMARQQQKKAGGSHHRISRQSGIPCAMVLRLIRDLPGARAFLPPSPARSSLASLASASGGQDHATSPSAFAALVRRSIRVHRIPASRVVTTARTSLFIEAG
jgi:hypothetical protein